MPGYLLYTFVFALPFNTRKLLFQFTPGFHEYEAAFWYASDILLALFFAAAYAAKVKSENEKGRATARNLELHILYGFLLLAGVSVFFAPSHGLALYSFARLFFAATFAAAVAYALRTRVVFINHVFAALAASAVFQSLIAFAQFAKQGSVGLRLLGEPALSAHAPGIAKFAAGGGKILRAYGTFPHPNVLGAFLVLGLLALCYLYLCGFRKLVIASKAKQSYIIARLLRRFTPRNDAIYIVGIFLVLLGLALTFSRAAWAIACFSSILVVAWGLAHQPHRRRALLLLFTLVASGYSLVATLNPFIFPRAHITTTEPSVVARLEYNRLGITLLGAHPFGIGIGNQVLYGVTNGLYQQLGMTAAWQWEPIHNIYILIAAELGIPGLALFLLFLLLLISNNKFQISKFGLGHFIWTLEFGISAAMLLSLMAFGMVDHFLWTLWPGQLMSWLVIGLVWGVAGREADPEVE